MVKIKFICTCCETAKKNFPKLRVPICFKLAEIIFIFSESQDNIFSMENYISFCQIDTIDANDFLKCKFQSIIRKSQNSYKSKLKDA